MKKIIKIILLIMIILTTYQITKTFALYKSEISKENEQKMGVWKIKVNGSEETEILLTDEYIKNAEVVEKNTIDGKIAPGVSMYFELLIDPSTTDASIKMICQLPQSISIDERSVRIKLLNVEEAYVTNNGKVLDTTKDEYSYLSIYEKVHKIENNIFQCAIPLKMIKDQNQKSLKVYFMWENYDEFNKTDTELGTTEEAKLEVPIKMRFEQYTGEK